MNFIKIFGFFIGLFITLLLISYVKINEPFTNIEHSSIEPFHNKTMIINENDDSILPYNGYKFMCINTYNDVTKLDINNGKWLDIDNNDLYFRFDKMITLDKNYINKRIGSPGANINHIQLNGPECFYFANNSETYEVIEFTMFMTIKIISSLNKNNILFEMTGNTTSTDKLSPSYTTSIININFIVRENTNYDIILLIGDKVYSGLANNIDKDIVENTDYLIVGLYYKKDKIGLIFNNKIYEYENLNTYDITLGSTPIIINKNGSFNMQLYNFVYYKSLFDFQYYDYLGRYNNYYLAGLHNHQTKCPVINEEKEEKKEDKEPEDFDRITLQEFKYPILHKYYDTYKNNFFDLFKKHNDVETNITINENNGSFFDLFKRHIENRNDSDVNSIYNSFDELKYSYAKNDNSFI
jgi:hypothetical protein